MAETDPKRPWLAAVLALASPGLGHVYLREWFRALLWFGLILSAVRLLVPELSPPDAMTVEAVMAVYQDVEFTARALAVVVGLFSLSMVDAYWMATAGNERAAAAEGVACPHCGKELDEDLTFCHWCTTELDPPAEDRAAEDRAVEEQATEP